MKREEKAKSMTTPPGMSQRREQIGFYLLLAAGMVHSLSFFRVYQIALEQLYRRQDMAWIPAELIWMEDFYVLARGRYLIFGLAMLWCVANVIFRYLYYYQGSKSIYLMRRLPARQELHRSCLVRPLQRMALCLGILMLILLISYAFYMENTPAQWLRPDQWQKMWRAIL